MATQIDRRQHHKDGNLEGDCVYLHIPVYAIENLLVWDSEKEDRR
jgi:hypothetical protein